MMTETLSDNATTNAPKASLIKRIGLTAYRLLEQMTESAYRQHSARLLSRYSI